MSESLSAASAPLAGRTASFVTMGCAKNEVDTADMRKTLADAGCRILDDPACADAVIVNTCSFIQSATEESLEAVFDAAALPRVVAGEAFVVVAGCMPARYGDDLAEELTEAAAFVPCSREDDLVHVLLQCFAARNLPAAKAAGPSDGSPSAAQGEAPSGEQPPTYAYVKISDGCDRWCSYCTIPLIRGRYRSFTRERVEKSVRANVEAGAREIVLIAQDTGRWGQDFEKPTTLASLVGDLADTFPHTWFRIMYLQPEGVTDDLLATMAAHENICSYLDIPLQHVNEQILRAMNRRGSRRDFERLVERVRTTLPNATLRTTLIAGFPGESDEQFEELCSFVEEGLFDYIGVFPYSREEQTSAFDLPGQIDEDEKAERAQRLRDLADAVCAPRIAGRIGRSFDVLVEGREEDGQLYGRAQCQAPEVDGVTYLDGGKVGDVVSVRIADTLLYEMEAE